MAINVAKKKKWQSKNNSNDEIEITETMKLQVPKVNKK